MIRWPYLPLNRAQIVGTTTQLSANCVTSIWQSRSSTGVGKCPNWTSPYYWGYNIQQIFEGDAQNPQKGTFTDPCSICFIRWKPADRNLLRMTDNVHWSTCTCPNWAGNSNMAGAAAVIAAARGVRLSSAVCWLAACVPCLLSRKLSMSCFQALGQVYHMSSFIVIRIPLILFLLDQMFYQVNCTGVHLNTSNSDKNMQPIKGIVTASECAFWHTGQGVFWGPGNSIWIWKV